MASLFSRHAIDATCFRSCVCAMTWRVHAIDATLSVGRRVTRAAMASIGTRDPHEEAVVVPRDLPQRVHGLARARRRLRVRDPDHVGLVFRTSGINFFRGKHLAPGLLELDDLGAVARRHVAVAQAEVAIY